MARLLGAILLAAFVIPNTMFGTLHAQVRGGGHRGLGGQGVVRMTPPVVSAPAPAFVGRPSAGFNGHRDFGGPGAFGAPGVFGAPRVPFVRPGSRPFVPQTFGGYYSPFIWNSPFYTASGYVDPAYVAPTYVAPQVNQNNAELEYQVQALSQEVERLRQEQQQQQQQPVVILPQPSPPPPPAPDVPAIPTTLVFRNGHKTSIQNFAIVGQTLWVLDDRTTTKISLGELNLQATQDENRSRGVRFPLPER